MDDHAPSSLFPLLQAVIYGDSAYPSGRYTLSHGLEGLVGPGHPPGADGSGKVLDDHLRYTAGPGDAVATACAALLATAPAHRDRPVDDRMKELVRLDAELSATKITAELRRASTRVGRQTLMVHGQVRDRSAGECPAPPRSVTDLLDVFARAARERRTAANQAVAMGLIHSANGLSPLEGVAVELLGLAVGWSSAALRLRQCDHVRAQAMVARSLPVISEVAAASVRAAEAALADGSFRLIGRASPGSDLASAAHETAPARLFMS